MSDDKKIVSIQYLRGLAALGVVLCHFGYQLTAYPKLSFFLKLGQSGVFVFFLISGFIIVYSLNKSNYESKQFFKFLLKRSIRIDPSYFATILLTIALLEFLNYLPSFKGNRTILIPGQLIAHIFYAVPFTKYHFYNHVFWTLSVEFQFYLLIGILYFLSDNRIFKLSFLVFFSLTCLIPFSNSYYLVFNYAPIFATGISLVNYYQNRTWSNAILPLLLLSLVEYKFGAPIFILLILSCVAILFFTIAIKPLKLLGDISYSLYLTHSLVSTVFLGIEKRLDVKTAENQLLSVFVELPVAILFAYLFYRIIEKPSSDLSKRFFYNKKRY
jgi:exopolysaccharide production protein ExoZ